MEGKAMLMETLVGLSGVPILLDTKDPAQIIENTFSLDNFIAWAVANDNPALINAFAANSIQGKNVTAMAIEVQQALGLDSLLLLNDFEALALSLPAAAGEPVPSKTCPEAARS